MKTMNNKTHIEGLLYQHTLEMKTSGPNSAKPGTVFITGNIDIATDDAMTNIVTVHYTYVTEQTSKGKANNTYLILKDMIDGTLGSVMANGADNAAKVRIDSAIGLNEFFSDRNGKEELVSAKRNEGGFIHTVQALNDDEKTRNTFDVDMIITGTRTVEADEEKGLPEKMILKGAIFDFRNALLPIELSVLNPRAIAYFDSLEITSAAPVFTRLQGRQVSEVVTRVVTEESAFGEPVVKKFSSTRKDYVVTWAASETYEWDDESSITAVELKKAMSERETYLATMKQRQDEYKASKGQVSPAAPAQGGFNF
jgi:hypothetical protein